MYIFASVIEMEKLTFVLRELSQHLSYYLAHSTLQRLQVFLGLVELLRQIF